MRQSCDKNAQIYEALLFYPKSFIIHYINLIYLVIALLVIVLLRGLYYRKTRGYQIQTPFYIVFFLTAIGIIFLTLTLATPNAVVIGVMTIPIAFTIALWLERIQRNHNYRFFKFVNLSILIAGLSHFGGQMINSSLSNPNFHNEGQIVNNIMFDLQTELGDREEVTVFWMLHHDGVAPRIMRVFLFERGEIKQVSKLNQNYETVIQVSAESLIESINESDIVIAPIIKSNTFLRPTPFNQSIMELSPIWSEILNNEFVIRNQFVYWPRTRNSHIY